jgi:hypothetical protein
MNKRYIYADEKTINFVNNKVEKIILIGSDFGYSNFGDILQLKGTIDFHKKNTNLQPILVFHIPVISNKNFIQTMRKMYGVEGILFITDTPLSFEKVDFELKLLKNFNSVNALHMYGGGFLNKYWGDFVLETVEDFMTAFHIDNYIISGQQIEESFAERVKEHIEIYKPIIIGVRDYDSKTYLNSIGVECHYSFDDATEKLHEIAQRVPKGNSNYIFGHINISSYTNASNMIDKIINNFQLLKEYFPNHSLNLINAFNDKRYMVCDTLGSLVEAEYAFPYDMYTVINGSNLAYHGHIKDMSLLNAKIAISSSYHVTMLMHFLKTPCWLYSNNSYYDQKRNALEIQGSLKDFLDTPYIPSYTEKLQKRNSWVKLLVKICNSFNKGNNQKNTLSFADKDAKKFYFKTNKIASVDDLKWHESNAQKFWEEAQHNKYLLNLEKDKLTTCQNSLSAKENELEQSRQQLMQIKNSLSYKVMSPLRVLKKMVKR